MRAKATCHPDRELQGHGLCRTCYAREYKRKRVKANPNKLRDYNLRRLYGISLEQYEEMQKAQGGYCAICLKPPKTRPLVVDHNHKTKAIRGLLCWKCNYGLTWLKDDPMLFRRAADYLEGRLFTA